MDFYYLLSEDNGITWSSPVQCTKYAGYDGFITNLSLFNNKPFIAFSSARWQQVYNTPHIWYGFIGETVDLNPPPALLFNNCYQYYFRHNTVETILANIADETGVKNVQVNITPSKVGLEFSLPLYDDGKHNDWGIGDGIFGAQIDSLNLGFQAEYSFTITDNENNTTHVSGFNFEVIEHNTPSNLNGGFEESTIGIKKSATNNWYLGGDSPAVANFEVIDDTVKDGNNSLKITVSNLGKNPWSVQAVNEPISLVPNSQYRYFIWAKADKDNVSAIFDIEES